MQDEVEYILISLEGNIGAGKTTLLKLLKESYPSALFLQEPLDNWQCINGNSELNLLEKYYNEPHRWGFTFQMYAYQSRLMEWCKQREQYESENKRECDTPTKIRQKVLVFTERSLESDRRIFLENAKQLKLVSDIEYHMYQQLYDFTMNKMNPFTLRGAIYVDLSATSCLQV